VSRLDREEVFAVSLEDAPEFFARNETPENLTADYHTRTGFPKVRADTLRRHHEDYEHATPLKGKEPDLLSEMTHPYVLEAIEERRDVRDDLESVPPSDLEWQGRLQTKLRTLDAEVKERRKRLGEITARIDDGRTLDAAQLSLLTDREDIDPRTEVINTLDGKRLTAVKSCALGTMNGGRFGASAQWSPTAARRLHFDLPRRLLRRTARKLGDKPRERSLRQHVEALGVERDPHFPGPSDEEGKDEETEKGTGATRPKRIPSTNL
jgi:hypothetical protein